MKKDFDGWNKEKNKYTKGKESFAMNGRSGGVRLESMLVLNKTVPASILTAQLLLFVDSMKIYFSVLP